MWKCWLCKVPAWCQCFVQYTHLWRQAAPEYTVQIVENTRLFSDHSKDGCTLPPSGWLYTPQVYYLLMLSLVVCLSLHHVCLCVFVFCVRFLSCSVFVWHSQIKQTLTGDCQHFTYSALSLLLFSVISLFCFNVNHNFVWYFCTHILWNGNKCCWIECIHLHKIKSVMYPTHTL